MGTLEGQSKGADAGRRAGWPAPSHVLSKSPLSSLFHWHKGSVWRISLHVGHGQKLSSTYVPPGLQLFLT